ncbi:MAG: hypothetical protein RR763_03540 [Massilia sp.]
MYDAFVTIKMLSRIARVDIMKTEDAIRIIEINEPPVFLVSSSGIWRRYPLRIRRRPANVTRGAEPIYERTQRVRTIPLLQSALLLKVFYEHSQPQRRR